MNRVRQQLGSMLRVEPRAAGFRATLDLDPAFMLFPDHFAGQPVLPGVCLVQAVLMAAANGSGELRLDKLRSAKFLSAASPGDKVHIDGDVQQVGTGRVHVKATLTVGQRRLALIVLDACQGESCE